MLKTLKPYAWLFAALVIPPQQGAQKLLSDTQPVSRFREINDTVVARRMWSEHSRPADCVRGRVRGQRVCVLDRWSSNRRDSDRVRRCAEIHDPRVHARSAPVERLRRFQKRLRTEPRRACNIGRSRDESGGGARSGTSRVFLRRAQTGMARYCPDS